MNYVIEKNVPLPSRANKWPFARMEVGDSVVIPAAEAHRGRSASQAIERSKGWKFATRRESGGLRIWRTA